MEAKDTDKKSPVASVLSQQVSVDWGAWRNSHKRSCRKIRNIMRRNYEEELACTTWTAFTELFQHRLDHTKTTSATSSPSSPTELRLSITEVSVYQSAKSHPGFRAVFKQLLDVPTSFTSLAVESSSHLHQQHPCPIPRASASNSTSC